MGNRSRRSRETSPPIMIRRRPARRERSISRPSEPFREIDSRTPRSRYEDYPERNRRSSMRSDHSMQSVSGPSKRVSFDLNSQRRSAGGNPSYSSYYPSSPNRMAPAYPSQNSFSAGPRGQAVSNPDYDPYYSRSPNRSGAGYPRQNSFEPGYESQARGNPGYYSGPSMQSRPRDQGQSSFTSERQTPASTRDQSHSSYYASPPSQPGRAYRPQRNSNNGPTEPWRINSGPTSSYTGLGSNSQSQNTHDSNPPSRRDSEYSTDRRPYTGPTDQSRGGNPSRRSFNGNPERRNRSQSPSNFHPPNQIASDYPTERRSSYTAPRGQDTQGNLSQEAFNARVAWREAERDRLYGWWD